MGKWLNIFKEEMSHQTPIQGTAIGDAGGADSLCWAVTDELGRLWQPGTRAYLESHRPELAQEIDKAEARLNAVWLAVDEGKESTNAFKAALEFGARPITGRSELLPRRKRQPHKKETVIYVAWFLIHEI